MSDASPAAATRPGRIAVLGAGAWGTALARLLGRNGHRVLLWARKPAHAAAVQADRENRRHLPGARLPDLVQAEGLHTVAHVDAYARRHGLDLPLTHEVHAVVHRGKAPAEALRTLMARQPTAE